MVAWGSNSRIIKQKLRRLDELIEELSERLDVVDPMSATSKSTATRGFQSEEETR